LTSAKERELHYKKTAKYDRRDTESGREQLTVAFKECNSETEVGSGDELLLGLKGAGPRKGLGGTSPLFDKIWKRGNKGGGLKPEKEENEKGNEAHLRSSSTCVRTRQGGVKTLRT